MGHAVTVRMGRVATLVHLILQHMKNHAWRNLWPAMALDARDYWRLVSSHVMVLWDWDGGGGGMKHAAELVGKSVAKANGKSQQMVGRRRRAAYLRASGGREEAH
jgi:hypothetical protein